MQALSGSWYESGTFWVTAAGVLISLLVGIGSIGVTYVVARPRLRLRYGVVYDADFSPLELQALEVHKSPLLHAGGAQNTGSYLQFPFLLKVELYNSGSRAITSTMYADGHPIELSIGAEIYELVSYRSFPDSMQAPPISWDESRVLVGPGLIGRRQLLELTMVVRGLPWLKLRSSLADVKTERLGAPLVSLLADFLPWAGALVAGLGFNLATGFAIQGPPGRWHFLYRSTFVWPWHAFSEWLHHFDRAGPYVIIYFIEVILAGAGLALGRTRRL